MLIGLCGKARAGKDFCANILKEEFNFQQLSFAKPLKDIIRSLFLLSDKHINGDLKEQIIEKYNKSPRQLMQEVGTIFRNIYPDIWVNYTMHQIEVSNMISELANALTKDRDKELYGMSFDDIKKANDIVISDVRYPNELSAIKNKGGLIWKIVRQDKVDILQGDTSEHSSETSLDSIPDSEYNAILVAKSGELDRLTNLVRINYSSAKKS